MSGEHKIGGGAMEFDIDASSRDKLGFYTASTHEPKDPFWENIHVIEYAAYEREKQMRINADRVFSKSVCVPSEEYSQLVDDLKAEREKLASLVEAAEYAVEMEALGNPVRCHRLKEAIAKIKESK